MSAPKNIPTAPWRRHAFWACLAALYAGLIFGLSAIPGSRLSEFALDPALANLGHIPLYAGFSALVLMALAGDLSAVRRGLWPTLYTLAAVMTYALFDEFHQRFVPGRTSSTGDIALDLLGAAIALVFLYALARREAGARGADQTRRSSL